MNYLIESKKGKDGEVRVLMLPDWGFDPKQLVEEVRALCNEWRSFVENASGEKPSFALLVERSEDFDDRTAQLFGPLDNLYSSMCTPLVAEAYAEAERLLTQCRMDIWSNAKFFRAHRSFRHGDAYRKLGKEEKAAFDLQLGSFKNYGVSLSVKRQARILKLEKEIEVLEQRFQRNLSASFNVPVRTLVDEKTLSGVSESAKLMMRNLAKAQALDPFGVSAKQAIRIPLLERADNRSLREAVYKSWATAASDIGDGGPDLDNSPVTERILFLRRKLARCYGKNNHAERMIEGRMAGTPGAVLRFLNSLQRKVVQNAKEETMKLEKFAKSELGYKKLEPWDIEYAKLRYLKSRFGYTPADLEQYLTFPRVLKTFFDLATKMYGVQIKERSDVKGWLPHVRFFEVYEHTSGLAGGFYFDPYARASDTPTKSESLWTQELLTRRRVGKNEIRLPVTIVHLNLPLSGEGDAQHLSHQDVIGLFHEFGHMLQNVLIKSNYLATGPENLEWDVIEIPSMLMENWAWDIETLAEMTWDKKKKRSAPLKLLLAIHRQRPIIESYGRWSLLEYLERATIDIALHVEKPRKGMIGRVVRRIRRKIGVLPVYVDDRFPNNFPYIFGGAYDAAMYSYLWAIWLGSAIRMEHFKTGHSVSPRVGRRFRLEFLEACRTRVAKESLTAFFGRRLPSVKALLEQSRFL